MRNMTIVVVLALGLVLLAGGEAGAAAPLSVGAQSLWGTSSSLGLGGRVSWSETPALVVDAYHWPSVGSPGLKARRTGVAVSSVLHLRSRSRSVRPYVGAGMSLIRTAGEVTLVMWDVDAAQWDYGAHILAGADLQLPRGPTFFLELRGRVWGGRQLTIGAGLRLPIVR
jgi:hypothetical protein